MKKFARDCARNVHPAAQQCRSVMHSAVSAAKSLHKLLLIFTLLTLSIDAGEEDYFEEKLNIIFYQFLEESDDVFMEIVPGDRFRLPLIRGYQVRIDHDKIEIIALTGREVVEPDGYIMPSGHVAQGYNLGRLSTLEYELLVHFDHQTDRYFFALRGDSIRVSPFRDEFTNVVVP